MLYSKYFIPTLREIKEECRSFDLCLRAGLVNALAAGMYTYLPLGLRVLKKIEKIIRKHMDNTGASELLMPAIHPVEIWKRTGRDEVIGEVMYRIKNRRGQTLCLGPTHEEIITDVVSKYISSYKQLPVTLYQIQTKFRDEIRPKGGLIRGCEFVMKDAYSFNHDQDSLDKDYNTMLEAYKKIFDECGLRYYVSEADSGFIGGSVSHEFLVPAESGEDKVIEDGREKNALELGHIFQLGTKYSEAMGAMFQDESGRRKPIIMGCYGIGVSRIISAVIEQNYDDDGIIWPKSIAPFEIEVICLDPDNQDIYDSCRKMYDTLIEKGYDVLFDERRKISSGVKFKDARLLGIPLTVTIGKKSFAEAEMDLEVRRTKEKTTVVIGDVQEIEKIYKLVK